MLTYVLWAVLGTLYGMIIGVIPIAGVTTALITVFSISAYFLNDPYAGIVFLTSIIASTAAADSYTSILTGIPGASTTAACVIDGYPMTQRGEAARAMGIAIADTTINGLFYSIFSFMLLPYYGKIILYFGIPEFAAFMILALACVGFVTSKNTIKSIIAIALGLYIGLIGQDPATGIPRFTFGWMYLQSGIQMIALLSGLFGLPELIWGFKERATRVPKLDNYWSQLFKGFNDVRVNWRDTLRGGFIGFITGLLPGVGGSVGDFIAYGATTAKHKEPQEIPFGQGNPIGLLGCEGANSAQKVSSMIPAILFGIPAAPFAAMIMAIAMYFGVEIGTPQLLTDNNFIYSVLAGYIVGTIGVALLSILFMKYIIKILEVPYWIYATAIIGIIIYANIQYTHGWEDLAVLGILSALGIVLKYFEISRPAILVTYVVASKLNNYWQQTFLLYDFHSLITRPIFDITILIAVVIVIRSITKKDKGLDYT